MTRYFVVEVGPETMAGFKRVIDDIGSPTHEYHDLYLLFDEALKIVDMDTPRLYMVFETDEDLPVYEYRDLRLYAADKLPEGEKRSGKLRLLAGSTIERILRMLRSYGFKLEAVPVQDPRQIQEDILRLLEGDGKKTGETRDSGKQSSLYEIILPQMDLSGIVRKGRKKLAQIARALAESFTENYYVRTPVIGRARLGIYCWHERRYVECEQFMKKWLKNVYDYYDMDKRGIKYTSLWKEYAAQLESHTMEPLSYEYLAISFRNIILDYKPLLEGDIENAFKPHSPEIFVRHYIPWNLDHELVKKHLDDEYTPENFARLAEKHTPILLKVFRSWVGEHWINLYEIIGYTLYPRYDLHKAIMLLGTGKNGKSTFLGLLRRLLGRENICSISLQKLTSEKDRFSLSLLHGKLANIYADLPPMPIKYTGKFKILTGEDVVTADRKYRDPIEFVNYAKLIFSANELPPVDDKSIAFWRRWIVIEFPNQFKPIPGFLDKLIDKAIDEIPRLLALSVIAIVNVLRKGQFTYEGSELDYKEVWLRRTDPVYAFLKDIIETGKYKLDPHGHVDKDVFYQEFIEWMHEHEDEYGGRIPDKREFTIALEKHGIRRVKIHKKYYYKGISYVGEGTPYTIDNLS